jgi:hemerythrin
MHMVLDQKYFTGVVWQDFQHQELLKKINQWILNHIFGDDKQLGIHILNAEKEKWGNPTP